MTVSRSFRSIDVSQSAGRYGGAGPAGGPWGGGAAGLSEPGPEARAEPRRSYRTKVPGSMFQAADPPLAFPQNQAESAVNVRACPRWSMEQRRGPTVLTSLSPCLFT